MRTGIALIVLIIIFSSLARSTDSKIRAFWVVRYALASESDIDKVIQTAYKSNMSDIFVQIRAKGNVYYHSSIESRSRFASGNFDPLKYLIEKSRLYGIRVHAWVNMFYIWSGSKPPEDINHTFFNFRKHILQKNYLPEYKELRDAGIEGYFLNPESMQVQKYLLNLLLEIADKYDVAGIHLDYFRYPGINFSFTPESRTEFMLENHFDPLGVYEQTDEYTKKRGFEVFLQADKQYREFLTHALSSYLSRINNALKFHNREILLSVAVKPDPVKAKHRFFQDWRSWLESDFCDFVLMMNYRTDLDEFNMILEEVNSEKLRNKIVVGISTYNQNEQAVILRMKAVHDAEFSGFSLFSYNHLSENLIFLKNLKLYN